MNPRGIGWHEITAANLLKLDLDGKILSNTDLCPGPAGLNFHSAILREKPELDCTIHVHPMQGVIVSTLEGGLQFFDQESCAIYGTVSYHEFEGLAQEADEAPRIIADLGDKYTMIMENHGLLTVGRTIGEAFTYMDKLLRACETQVPNHFDRRARAPRCRASSANTPIASWRRAGATSRRATSSGKCTCA